MSWLYYRFIYRRLMKFAHKYNWHHAPPIYPEGGDTLLWCQWCGFRSVINRQYENEGIVKSWKAGSR